MATFGRYRDGTFDRPAWLVVLEGAAPPQSLPPGFTPTGGKVTRVVIDAEKGIVLRMSFVGGL